MGMLGMFDFEKMEKEMGAENVEKFMDTLLDGLVNTGDIRAILFKEYDILHKKMRVFVSDMEKTTKEQKELQIAFLKQINSLFNDFIEEMEK